jgi:hypothetical protein
MGVSIVLLPFGVPLGLLGVFVFLWGCFGRTEKTPPGPVAGVPADVGRDAGVSLDQGSRAAAAAEVGRSTMERHDGENDR